MNISTPTIPTPINSATAALDLQTGSDHDLIVGDVFRDTRPEVKERVYSHIKKLRKRGSPPYSLPNRIHWRVLRVVSDETVLISVEDPLASPQRLNRRDVSGLLATRSLIKTDHEPLAILRFPENQFSSPQISCRDRNLRLIQPLIDLGDEIFDERRRWIVIKEICKTTHVQPTAVYRILRRYFQGGLNANALAGRWFRRSLNIGRGSRLLCKAETRSGERPRRVGRPRLDGFRQFLVTEEDVRKIVRGAGRYYHTPEGGNWRRAWLLSIADNYIDIDPNSKQPLDEQLKEFTPDCYPSLAQFRHWANTDAMIVQRAKNRMGERRFNLSSRPLNGKTEHKALGPGHRFQIDSTPLDIVAVHSITRRPIGRPVLYLVVDAFSHLIVGFYVYLGNPGYDVTALALLATAENKVDLCRCYGVQISPYEWPAECLPAFLIGDSELSSSKAHSLVKKGASNLTIVPAYRADLKGLVEALLGATKRFTKHAPGYTQGFRKRAEDPADATAALDIHQIIQIIIHWIRQENRRFMPDYELTQEMIVDGLVATPLNIWLWGVKNRTGFRRKFNMEYLKRLLLPTGTGYITRRGLEFSGMVYEPQNPSAIDFDAWRVLAAAKTWIVPVTYHPDSVNELYLHHDGQLVSMHLSAVSNNKRGWSFGELEAYESEQAMAQAAEAAKSIPVIAVLERKQQRIMEEGKRLTEAARGSVAQRRKEKLNKPAERKDQRDLISGRPPEYNHYSEPIISHELANEDEQRIADELRITRGQQ